MKNKILKQIFTSCMLLSMTLALVTSNARAEEVPEENKKVGITKTLNIAEGTTIPTATFSFQFEAKDNAPIIPSVSVAYSNTDILEDGATAITKDSDNIFENVTYIHAGVYKYVVSEIKDTYTKIKDIDNMTYDKSTYEMTVLVKNKKDGSGVFISAVYIKKIEDGVPVEEKEEGTPGTDENIGVDYYKLFTNTYEKKAGVTPENPEGKSLIIGKDVTGAYGDKTKEFTFNITFLNNNNGKSDAYIGNLGENGYTFKEGETTEVNLKHGDRMTFDELPTGIHYTISESGTTNYTPSYNGKSNGIDINGSASKGENLAAENILVGENANSNIYTNEYDDEGITPTGIIINNLPFILLIFITIMAFVLYIISKRHKYTK